MLIKCLECNKDMSDSATSCPHCGFILKALKSKDTSKEAESSSRKKALFQFISLGAIIVALFTPRILISLPCLVIISSGIIALFRKEPRWFLSVSSIVIGFFLIGAFDTKSDYIGKMEIQKGDWTRERDYSYVRGRVKNGGDKTVTYFEITALYKDASGTVLDTDYTNSGETLQPGMSKEFEIMHKESLEYRNVSIATDAVRTQ